MKKLSYALSALVLAGCGFAPTPGDYDMISTAGTTTCETDDTDTSDDEPSTAVMSLTENEDGTFTMHDTDADDTAYDMVCTLDGKAFTCETITETMDLSVYSMDALVTITINVSGEFTASDAFTGTTVMDMACTGADCEAIGMQTCTSNYDFTGALVSAAE